jgi:hypothetical protein
MWTQLAQDGACCHHRAVHMDESIGLHLGLSNEKRNFLTTHGLLLNAFKKR